MALSPDVIVVFSRFAPVFVDVRHKKPSGPRPGTLVSTENTSVLYTVTLFVWYYISILLRVTFWLAPFRLRLQNFLK